jgi:YggT family protein
MILSIRIILTWFKGSFQGKAGELLKQATDPYLEIFSRLSFLKQGMFDFTPLAAILGLVVALDLVNGLLVYGRITIGLLLASIISALWGGLSFILLIFLVLGVVQIVSALFSRNSASPMLQMINQMFQPIIDLVTRFLRPKRELSYNQYLYISLGLIFFIRLLGGILISRLVHLLYALPV